MKNLIFKTNNDWAGLALRIALGGILFPHSAQKLLGWFGGYGFTASMGYMTETVGLPWIVGFAAILFEFFGSLLLLAGLGGRLVAFGTVFLMVGIITTVHLPFGFFMDWDGVMQGEGYEFHLLYIGAALGLMLNGSGKYSVDALLTARQAAVSRPAPEKRAERRPVPEKVFAD